MINFGPLAVLQGKWEGNVGVDVSYSYGNASIGETTFFEKAWFHPEPAAVNGDQSMAVMKYEITSWRHGEEDANPFHNEVGYFLWEESTTTIMRCMAVPRGIGVLQGAVVEPGSKVWELRAEQGSETFGLVQNPHLVTHATCGLFTTKFTIVDDDTISYESDLHLVLKATGEPMNHTDKNTWSRVGD